MNAFKVSETNEKNRMEKIVSFTSLIFLSLGICNYEILKWGCC